MYDATSIPAPSTSEAAVLGTLQNMDIVMGSPGSCCSHMQTASFGCGSQHRRGNSQALTRKRGEGSLARAAEFPPQLLFSAWALLQFEAPEMGYLLGL